MPLRRWIGCAAVFAVACSPDATVPEQHSAATPELSEQVPVAQQQVDRPAASAADSFVQQAAEPLPATETKIWIVRVEGLPTALGGDKSKIAADLDESQRNLREAGIEFVEQFRYHHSYKGFAIELSDPGHGHALTTVRGVLEAHPDEQAWPTQDRPTLANAVTMTNTPQAHARGFDGDGILVGIIDTGVDYDHPDLGGCFGVGCRVEGGYDFVGDSYGSPGGQRVPDDDPDDCDGHGTHVAGIVGASGWVDGVAPAVRFRAYRVFGCDGGTTSSVLLAAIDRAVADGVDVINYSIGSDFTSPLRPSTVAASNAVAAGIVFVASAGNSQPGGLYVNGGASVASDVISVASINNTHLASHIASFSSGQSIQSLRIGNTPPLMPQVSASVARTGTPSSNSDACSALPANSLDGMVALVRRGGCSFAEKGRNAEAAGAIAALVYNTGGGYFMASASGGTLPTIPMLAISGTDGIALDASVSAGALTFTMTDDFGAIALMHGGVVSSFSSFGPSFHLEVKPDLAAPGGSILSTYPVEKHSYGVLSGTSMASPHAAGAAALLLQSDTSLTPAQVKARLQTYAKPVESPSSRGFDDQLDHVWVQGAGLIDINASLSAPITVSPGDLPLRDARTLGAPRTLTFTNTTSAAVTLTASHRASEASRGALGTHTAVEAAATVSFSESEIVIGANSSATVDVTFAAPTNLSAGDLFGGYLTFAGVTGGPLVVPFSGHVGQYPAAPTIRASAGLPRMVRPPATSALAAGQTFNLRGRNVPSLNFFLSHSPDLVEVHAEATSSGARQLAHRSVFGATYGSPYAFFTWNGWVDDGPDRVEALDDEYALVLRVLQPLGDPNNPASWEEWTSPSFTVDRPNRAPTLDVPATIEGREGVAMDYAISARDLNRDPLTYGAVNLPTGAAINTTTGHITWTPSFGQAGTHSIGVTVSDGARTAVGGTILVISEVNRAPVINAIGAQSVMENVALTFDVTATDADGDTVSITAEDLPTGATFNAGTFAWTPSLSQSGLHTFTVIASDGDLEDSAEVEIEVRNVNRAPSFPTLADISATESDAVTVDVAASDPDGDSVTVTMSAGPAAASFDGERFHWQTGYDDAGQHTVTLVATDGDLEATASFVIDVANRNRAPSISDFASIHRAEGHAISFTASATDPDGDALTFSVVSGLPVGATFDAGQLDWTPGFDQAGAHAIVLQVSDGELTAEATLDITVENTNRAPELEAVVPQATLTDEVLTFSVVASDDDGDSLTFSATDLPTGSTFDDDTGRFDWTPNRGDIGRHLITVSVTDGSDTDSTVVEIDVDPANRPPVFGAVSDLIIAEGEPFSMTVAATDPDGDALVFTANQIPAGATFSPAAGTLAWTPPYDAAGTHLVELQVTDGSETAVISFAIEVTDTNRPPSLPAVEDMTVEAGDLVEITAATSDADGDALTYTVTGLPGAATMDAATGVVRWTPTASDAGTYTVTVTVTDGTSTVTATFDVTVTPAPTPNDPATNDPTPHEPATHEPAANPEPTTPGATSEPDTVPGATQSGAQDPPSNSPTSASDDDPALAAGCTCVLPTDPAGPVGWLFGAPLALLAIRRRR